MSNAIEVKRTVRVIWRLYYRQDFFVETANCARLSVFFFTRSRPPLPTAPVRSTAKRRTHPLLAKNNRYVEDGLSTDGSIGMATSTDNDEHFMTGDQFDAANQDTTTNNVDDYADTADDAATAEAMQAVTKERHQMHKENAAKLQSILENIKHSTKIILREMDTYLQETEEVEKTFIRCRASTQKESQRMEQVEPEVIAATQRKNRQLLSITLLLFFC